MTNAETTGHDTGEAPTEEASEEGSEAAVNDTADTADTATGDADAGNEVDTEERLVAEGEIAGDADAGNEVDTEERLVAEGEIAGDYLEELLDLLDFDGDIDLDVEGSRAVVSIDGSDDLNKLVGRKGEVLDALQELTRLAVHQKTGVRSRLMLDIASWRRRRREELAALGDKVARRVLESGDREELAPMTPFERKIVHDAVAAVEGVRSESEGVEPSRRVVVLAD
jgi:spoIIIJ-associated protein